MTAVESPQTQAKHTSTPQPSPIQKAAVIGAGVMGAAIAAQLTNAGIPVVLLDIVLPDKPDRNFLAKAGIERALKASPAAFMAPENARLITPGNLDDDLAKIKDADWIIEAIIEKLDAKRDLWEKVEKVAKKTAIISSNSSGIPMHLQVEGRSEDFKRRFVGAHFFNPPRYLHLLEVIPTDETSPEITRAFSEFADHTLGKGVVVANDVPGFVGNRIGVYGMVRAMKRMEETGLTPAVVDLLTGPAMGRPKSATFRTADLSGLDIIYHVANDIGAVTGAGRGLHPDRHVQDTGGRQEVARRQDRQRLLQENQGRARQDQDSDLESGHAGVRGPAACQSRRAGRAEGQVAD